MEDATPAGATSQTRSRPTANAVELRGQIWIAFAALAAVALSATRVDPDLWGHLRFGLDWWGTRALPLRDTYSFTQDRPWINHEWLSESLMAAAYLLGGTPGLIVLKMIVMTAALAVLARRLRGSTPLLTASVMAVGIVAALPISGTVRPQLWSVLGLVLLITIVDTREQPTWRRIIAAVCLFAAWANLHGGWITGAAILIVYAAVRVLRVPQQVPAWAVLVAGSVGGTVLNPYGVNLWRFLANTVRASRADITEWQPLGLDGPAILWLPPLIALAFGLALSRRRESRPRAEVWAALLLLVAASIRVSRVAPLMGIPALALVAPCIRRAWGHTGRLTAPSAATAGLFFLPALIMAITALPLVARAMACIPITGTWKPDDVAGARLRGLSGRLLTTFDWGEYAIWHFGPALRVSIDGRRETIYSDAVIEWHRAFERGDPEGQAVVAQLAPEYVWLPADRRVAKTWLATHGYAIEAETDQSFIAVRRGLPRLAAAGLPLPRCFP